MSDRLVRVISLSGKLRAARPVDADAITGTIHRALSSAGLDTQSGQVSGIGRTIEKALSAAGLNQRETGAPAAIEGMSVRLKPGASPVPARGGEVVDRSFTNDAGTRTYQVYIPGSYSIDSGDEVPMIVMLHGCTQSPDDFAVGTQMNALAEQYGFVVVYPAQAANANGSKCWNWFRAEDQRRDSGEPSLIAGITQEVASLYRIDRRRIFVAGLSAGAAMAVILGVTYPELYAAVGAHSGLPYAAAHDVSSAFSVMKSGGAPAGLSSRFSRPRAPVPGGGPAVPTIVFHGDADSTVAARNGAAIVESTIAATDPLNLRTSTHGGVASGGRTYSRTVYADADDDAIIEHWVLHGAGHAWSGGSGSGSYTDPSGPDASAEMIRFFYAQKRAGSA